MKFLKCYDLFRLLFNNDSCLGSIKTPEFEQIFENYSIFNPNTIKTNYNKITKERLTTILNNIENNPRLETFSVMMIKGILLFWDHV